MTRHRSLRTLAVVALALAAGQLAGTGRAAADTAPVMTFAFASAAYQVDEAAGLAEIEVVRTGSLEQAAYVHFETADGTADRGSDYTSESKDVVFAPGDASEIVQVPIVDDNRGEGDETIRISLSKPSLGALGDPSSVWLEILDNDKAFAFYFDILFASEGDGSAIIAVRRMGLTTGTDSVDFATGNGSAEAGSDYTAVSTTLTFAPGEATKFVSILIADDRLVEADETIGLTLSKPSAGTAVQTPSASTLTIYDNDKAKTAKKPSGKITSARLTKTSFTSAQASVVKLIYRFHPKSEVFRYVLFVKKDAGWALVRKASKTGVFAGKKTLTVKKLFGPKPILSGRYRLKLSADRNSKMLRFTVR